MPANTCSESCRVARANRRERERYERIKGTEHFKLTPAAFGATISPLSHSAPWLPAGAFAFQALPFGGAFLFLLP